MWDKLIHVLCIHFVSLLVYVCSCVCKYTYNTTRLISRTLSHIYICERAHSYVIYILCMHDVYERELIHMLCILLLRMHDVYVRELIHMLYIIFVCMTYMWESSFIICVYINMHDVYVRELIHMLYILLLCMTYMWESSFIICVYIMYAWRICNAHIM